MEKIAEAVERLDAAIERRNVVSNESRAQELQALITRAERQLAMLAKIPNEDTYPDGTILRIVIVSNFDDAQFTYVLLKVVNEENTSQAVRWYHTGSRGRVSITRSNGVFLGWTQVQEWLHSQRNIVSLDVMVPQSERDQARSAALHVARVELDEPSFVEWYEKNAKDWSTYVEGMK